MKRIMISASILIASCAFASCNAQNQPKDNRQVIEAPTTEHAAVFTIESVIDVDTNSNVIHYMDYDAFDPDNMDWCSTYDADKDEITVQCTHADAVMIASGKVDIWNAEQFTLWFDESGHCRLARDGHWLD